jgi:hypothetical protein
MTITGERSGAASLTVVFLIVTFCLSTFDITEHDYWWHLATGKYILTHRIVPSQDVFSYTATRPWVAHYWLADAVGYALYRSIGTPGMILLNAAVITFSFWLVYRTAVAAGAGTLVGVSVTLLAAFASRSRFYVRPETCSFLLTAVYLALFQRWKQGGGSRCLLAFPLLQCLWTNLYGGGSVVGLILLFCFSAGETLNAFLHLEVCDSRQGKRRAAGLVLVCLAAFALSFVNPNGHRTVFYFMMSRDPIFRHIVEWRHMEMKDLIGLHGLFLFGGALLLLRSVRKPDFTEFALFLVFAYASIDAPRSLPFFAMVAVPLIGPRARGLLEGFAVRRGFDAAWRRNAQWIQCALACAVVVFTIWYLSKDVGNFASDYVFGLGVNKKLVPIQAVDFLEDNGIQGPLFNSYGIGGYLIWRLYPRMKVFVDGRVEMYGTDFLKTYMLYWQPDVWEDYVRRYGINCAIIDREPNYTTRYLDENPAWALVFFDDRAMVYLRNVPRNEELIRKYGYRYLRPASQGFGYLDRYLEDPAAAGAVIEELRRSLHGDETYNLNVHLMLGYYFAKMGRQYLPLALVEYRAALHLMPEGKDIQEKICWLERQISKAADERGF